LRIIASLNGKPAIRLEGVVSGLRVYSNRTGRIDPTSWQAVLDRILDPATWIAGLVVGLLIDVVKSYGSRLASGLFWGFLSLFGIMTLPVSAAGYMSTKKKSRAEDEEVVEIPLWALVHSNNRALGLLLVEGIRSMPTLLKDNMKEERNAWNLLVKMRPARLIEILPFIAIIPIHPRQRKRQAS